MDPQSTTSTTPEPVAGIESRRRRRPGLYWYLSFRCNLSCAHCWVGSSPRVDASHDLTPAEAMRVVDQIADLDASACTLSGGEILTRPDALDIVEALAERGVYVWLETNGLLIRDRFVEVAARLQRAGKLGMGISLDGGTAETHERMRGPRTFERTLRTFRRLAAAGVRFNAQCILNRSNIETIPALYDLAAELWPSLRCLGFGLLNPLGRGEDLSRELGVGFGDLERILDLVAEHRGRFPGSTVVKAPPAAIPPRHLGLTLRGERMATMVSCEFPLLGVLPDGEVTICALSRDNEELRFGNVRDTTLREIWQRARIEELRRRYLAPRRHLQGVCGDCVWSPSCRGACRAWAYDSGGSFDASYPLCAALDAAGEFPTAYRRSALGAGVLPVAAPACAACPAPEVQA